MCRAEKIGTEGNVAPERIMNTERFTMAEEIELR